MIIEGLKQTSDALDALDKTVAKRILRKGLRVGAKVMLTAARAKAPTRTGVLKRNIKIRSGRSGNGTVRVNVGIGSKDFTGKAFYGAFVLYGHKVGSRKLGDKRKSVPANDFLGRAYDKTKEQAVTTAAASWGEQIEESAAKGGT